MAPSTSTPISIAPPQATHLSHSTRNEIYSAILSGPGIVNIEATLTHELQRTGWLANLKQYITQLLRSGEATTVDEIMVKVTEKMGLVDAEFQNGLAGLSNGTNGVENGVVAANGNGNRNGVNGHNSTLDVHVDLKVPAQAITEVSRVIRRELEDVCEIATE